MSKTEPSNRYKRGIVLYAGIVIAVFGALMMALFNDGQTPAGTIEIPEEDIVAIIEEYQGDRVSRVSVSLNDLEAVVPEPAMPAWVQNAAAVPSAPSSPAAPKIAIIIDDLGLDKPAGQRLTEMPGPYTLAYLPYATELKAQTEKAREAGHELIVHMPMQSHRNTADPGDNALLEGLSFEEFSSRIEWNLTRFDGFVGINNHMGSLITEDPALMVRVMARLRNEGLLFVDSLTTPKSMGKRAAKALGVPFVARDIFLDNELSEDYIKRQLASTEKIARLRGYAIAIGHPHQMTIDVLEEWQQSLAFKGISLVPVSQIMNEVQKRQQVTSR